MQKYDFQNLMAFIVRGYILGESFVKISSFYVNRSSSIPAYAYKIESLECVSILQKIE